MSTLRAQGPKIGQLEDALLGGSWLGPNQLTMEGIWSLDLGLFRLEWARFLAHVPGAMLGHFVAKIYSKI